MAALKKKKRLLTISFKKKKKKNIVTDDDFIISDPVDVQKSTINDKDFFKNPNNPTSDDDLKILLKTVRRSISHLESKLNDLEIETTDVPPPVPPKPYNLSSTSISQTPTYHNTNTNINTGKALPTPPRSKTIKMLPRTPQTLFGKTKKKKEAPPLPSKLNINYRDKQLPYLVTPRTLLPTGRQIGKDFDGFDLYDNTNGIEKDFGEIKDINDKKYTQNDKDDISINTTVWALYYDEQWYKAKVLKVQYYEAGNIYHVVYEGYGDTVYQLGRESIDLIENDIKN